MTNFKCQCGWNVFTEVPITVTCPICGSSIVCGERLDAPQRNKAIDRANIVIDKWPLWAEILRRYSKPTDCGVGDTVERLAARLGGDGIKWLASKVGMPCGCAQRQSEWNRLYPYEI